MVGKKIANVPVTPPDLLAKEVVELGVLPACRSHRKRVADVERHLMGLNSHEANVKARACSFLAQGLNEYAGLSPDSPESFTGADFSKARYSMEFGVVYFRHSKLTFPFVDFGNPELSRHFVSTFVSRQPSEEFSNVSNKLGSPGCVGITVRPTEGCLANSGVIIVDDLLDKDAISHEGRHRDDRFLNVRSGADRSLSEVLATLEEFPPGRYDWSRFNSTVQNNGFVKNCISSLEEPARGEQCEALNLVLTNCERVYGHIMSEEGFSPKMAGKRLMHLVESSLSFDQFNSISLRIINGMPSQDAVTHNLNESVRAIRSRMSQETKSA